MTQTLGEILADHCGAGGGGRQMSPVAFAFYRNGELFPVVKKRLDRMIRQGATANLRRQLAAAINDVSEVELRRLPEINAVLSGTN